MAVTCQLGDFLVVEGGVRLVIGVQIDAGPASDVGIVKVPSHARMGMLPASLGTMPSRAVLSP